MKKNTNRTDKSTIVRSRLTDQDKCDILDDILNRSGIDYTERQIEAIDEAFTNLMVLVG